MLRVIVVDDEKHIRDGIGNFINNELDGFVVEHCFSDGDEAIDYLKDKDTDIVISDIRMSRKSGLDVARFIYENKPYIKMIIISGYQDFEYAQSAISYGIKAYLLKPTDFDELTDILNSFRNQIDKEKNYLENFMDSSKRIFSMIVQSDKEAGMGLMDEIFTLVGGFDYQNAKTYIVSFLEILNDKILANLKVDLKVLGIDISVIKEIDDREELYKLAREMVDRIFTALGRADNNENNILQKAKKYIDENFSSDISLQDVADYVYLNPAYFSRFFKVHTGENFSDYLLEKRMKKAAELLSENKKIAEVCTCCGYKNPGYFSRTFKEYYKCTPYEYARKVNY